MNRNRVKTSVLYLVAAMLTLTPCSAQEPASTAPALTDWFSESHNASITSMVKAKTADGQPIYKVSYKYDFGTAKPIYIKGIGNLSGKGQLAYLTYDPQIEFRESVSGPVLVVLKSHGTIGTLGVTIDLPQPRDFPQPPLGREGRWGSKRPLQGMATETANKNKLHAYAYEQDGLSYLTTSYTGLQGLPTNLIGQIALRISYPHRKGTDAGWYRVEYAARERRAKEDKWILPARRQEILEACTQFVDQFINELQATVATTK